MENTAQAESSEKPGWIKLKPAEVEKLIIELAQKGETPEKIGLILRDQHGIPKVKLMGKKISRILRENKISYRTQKERVNDKIKNLEQHIARKKHDVSAKRSLSKNLWVLNR